MQPVPSSKNRRRVELPAALYDRLKQTADAEGRTVAGVVVELLGLGLRRYKPAWVTGGRRDNLTPRAERVLKLAREDEPRRFNHNYVGTEHLLLALVDERDGPAARALTRSGVTTDKVVESIEFMIGRGPAPFEGTPTETPRTKIVLGLAAGEAQKLDHALVGSGHLLLALIREGEGIAAGILESLGVDMLELRDAVLESFARGEMPLAET
ncbi:MAG TPA: Clp protease N-terminal domain-containing protein [Chloroflexota bacterium]|jgi:ATP-dependent Clp protease ATP-binding subunit ClpA|nr:Clp protease N-terminal domain-containing protein [Chloroflexota bacterium]